MLEVIPPLETSVAVSVRPLPAKTFVTTNVAVPELNAVFAGIIALASFAAARCTVSPDDTTFQFASTALTVTLNPLPAVRVVGAPVLPGAKPGVPVSPGSNNCNCTSAPGVMLTLALVPVFVPVVAVSVRLSAFRSFTLMVKTPLVKALRLSP